MSNKKMIDEKFLVEFLENFSVVELQNATLYYKKEIIKKTLRTLSTPNARRKYLKQLGIRFDDKKQLFSGGATYVELEYLLCPITKKIFVEPVVAEDGVTYEESALIAAAGRGQLPLRFVPNNVMRNMVFRLKSETPNDSRVRRFFEHHWNHELIAQLGLDINPPGLARWRRSRFVLKLIRGFILLIAPTAIQRRVEAAARGEGDWISLALLYSLTHALQKIDLE